MGPHSPNYTPSSHYYLKLCPRLTGTRASDRNIVMGARRGRGCERHSIFSGNWSVIVKTSPITNSHVTDCWQFRQANKLLKLNFSTFILVSFSMFALWSRILWSPPIVCYAPGLVCRTPRLWGWSWPRTVDLSPGCKESWSHELMSLRHKLSAHNQNGFSSSWTASLTISQKSQVVNCIRALKSLVIFGLVNFYVNFDFNVMVLYVYDFFPPDENSRVSEKFFRK